MSFGNILGGLLKGKILATTMVCALAVGGTAAMAATPAGQNVVHTITGAPQSSPTAMHTSQKQNDGKEPSEKTTPTTQTQKQACPGLSDAQNLASKYTLSTDAGGADVQTICSLHAGTFQGKTSSGANITESKVYGYGEIDQLLIYAQYLAQQDKANGGKLTDENVAIYLADALQRCGTDPLAVCLKNNIPNNQPGNSGTSQNGSQNTTNGNGQSTNSNKNGQGGKPESTPTPAVHKP